MQKMKVLLKRKVVYELTANGVSIGNFGKESTWEGMTKLKTLGKRAHKEVIIESPSVLEVLLNDAMDNDAAIEVVIIKASPVVVDKIKEAFDVDLGPD